MKKIDRQLVLACEDGDLQKVRELIAKGADLYCDLSEEDGGWPLQCASMKGHIGVVKELIGAGLDVNQDGGTSFCAAIREGHADVVEAIAKAGVCVSISDVLEASDFWVLNKNAKSRRILKAVLSRCKYSVIDPGTSIFRVLETLEGLGVKVFAYDDEDDEERKLIARAQIAVVRCKNEEDEEDYDDDNDNAVVAVPIPKFRLKNEIVEKQRQMTHEAQ